MGAAASVKMLYKDALEWFRQYIDTETYMEDFKSMDKHNENALTFTDVRDWITLKAKKDPLWRIFLTSGPVLTIAHKYACQHGDRHTSVSAAKMVDVTEFKTLLVHLFAISILWSHFQNAEKWEESGSELAGHRLNFQAFKLACHTFDSAHFHEELSDEEIKSSFELIDSNNSGSVGFIEVCNHCCKFIDDPEIEKKIQCPIPKFFGDVAPGRATDLVNELTAGPKNYYIAATIDQKNHEMILALTRKLSVQADNLKSASALEHQNNIRRQYNTISLLIDHPICCGFLLKFCNDGYCAENLTFVREVDEFRDLFNVDKNIWNDDWKVIDVKVKLESDDICDDILMESAWPSGANQKLAVTRIEAILDKFVRDGATTQINISEATIKRTVKRAQLLNFYGPSVFDEACIDPMLTMKKDILPRFRVSDIVSKMVMRVASCEPPPVATELYVPPPMDILLAVSTIEDFPDGRNFSLDEIIGCQHLYLVFLEVLEKQKLDDLYKLLFVRKIDIFEELMAMKCLNEATNQAWEIFRYFITEGAPFEMPIAHLDRKQLMLKLAEPRRGMFEDIRKTAYDILTADFQWFKKSPEYRGFAELMREQKISLEKCGTSRQLSSAPLLEGGRRRSTAEQKDMQNGSKTPPQRRSITSL